MTKKQIFALAAFVYLFLAPFTFHPDIKTIFYQSQFLSQGIFNASTSLSIKPELVERFNIYSFFAANPDKAFLGNFVYPPLAYFLFGIFFIPVKLLAGTGFVEWLGMGNDSVVVPHIFQYLFVIKLPAIIAHFTTGYFIFKLLQGVSLQNQNKALALWFFNPISLYTVGFMGQIDSIAVLLTVLALFLAKKKSIYATVLLGLGAAFKTYPLLILPFLAIYSGKTWSKRLLSFVLGFGTYLLFILPFITTPAFYSSTFVSGLSQRLFELKLYVGFGENILIVPAILIVLFLFAVSKKLENISQLSNFFLATLFIVVALVHFHPQWALWFLPFLVILVINKTKDSSVWVALALLFLGWLGTVLLFDDKFLSWGILAPIDPGILFLPTLSELLHRFFDPLLAQSIFHTLMLASGVYLVSKSFKENE